MITGLQVHEYKLPHDKKQFRASLTSGKYAGITSHLQWLIILTAAFCRLPVIALGKKVGMGEEEGTRNGL